MRSVLSMMVLVLVSLPACSDGDDPGEGDAGDAPRADAGAQASCGWNTARATFSVVSRTDYGGFSGSYRTAPPVATLEEKLREGSCAYYAPEPSFCDPACEVNEACAVGGVCMEWPTTIAIGHLTVTGTTPTLELDPQPGFSYYTMESHPNLYAPGDDITLSATGAGDVGAFSLSTRGAPHLTGDWEDLVAVRDQPFTVTWNTDAQSPAGAQVVVHLDNDHHGLAAYVECIADDADGSVTVSPAVLNLLIDAGASGIGTYIENAYITRLSLGTLDGDDGCVAFASESHSPIYVDTIP